jgi:WD40 repeat protein
MEELLSKVLALSLPTQAILLISFLSISYIIINVILAILRPIFSIIVAIIPRPGSGAAAQESEPKYQRGAKKKAGKPTSKTGGRYFIPSGREESSDTSTEQKQPQQHHEGVSLKSLIKNSKKSGGAGSGPDRHADSELFINGLRGHTDSVTGLAFSSDGKTLATACEDRCLRIFDLSVDVAGKNIPFKQFDLTRHGVHDVAFSVNATHVAVMTQGGVHSAGLCFLDVSQKEAATLEHLENIFIDKKVNAGLCLRGSGGSGAANNVPVIVAAAPNSELNVYLASPSLPLLKKLDTGGMINYNVAISNDGRFIAAATFASDVKVYEVEFDRTGSNTGIKKVMDLKGHRKKITAVEFSPDGRHAVTASEDGTLRIWDINVRYKQQEDPKTLVNEGLPAGKVMISKFAWGRGGQIAAVAGSDIYLLSATTGKVVDVIYGAHSGEINDIAWSPTKVEGPQGLMTLLATAGNDNRVRLWRGPWPLF